MVSAELLASVSALDETDRLELIAYIEQTLDHAVAPTAEQHELVARRVAAMKADPALGLSLDEVTAAARALIA